MNDARPSDSAERLREAAHDVADEQHSEGEEQEASAESSTPALHVGVDVNRLKIPSVIMVTAGVLFTLFLAWVVFKVLDLLLLLYMALLIATAIEPLVNRLRRGPFNRTTGILVVYTGLFLIIAAIGYLTLPILFQQLGELGSSLQKQVGEMQQTVQTWDTGFLKTQAIFFLKAVQSVVGKYQEASTGTPDSPSPEQVQTAATTAITVAEVFFAVITIFVIAFYWLTERTMVKRALMSWLPAKRANRVRRVWDDIEVKVGGWVRGQLTLMLIVGALSAIGYFVMGIQYAPALALFIAVAEAIPLVGPYIGTAPAVLVALTQPDGGVGKALMVVAFAIVLQMVEGNVLVPRVMRNSVGISPLTVIISILFGAALAGLAGALVAVPIAGSLQVIIADIKAAKESDEKLAEVTEAAAEQRAADGELVVAHQAGSETKTHIGSKAAEI